MEELHAGSEDIGPMSSIHSLADNLVSVAIMSGWRIDAILMGGVLWALMSAYTQLKTALA